jgi:hypothetical protein
MANEQGSTPRENPNRQPLAPTPGIPLLGQGIVASAGAVNGDESKENTKQLAKEVHWITHATFWSQVALGLIGVAALWIYHCQLTAMQGQLDQMDRQTALTRQQIIGSQGAVLVFDPSISVPAIIAAVRPLPGRVTAKDVEVRMTA